MTTYKTTRYHSSEKKSTVVIYLSLPFFVFTVLRILVFSYLPFSLPVFFISHSIDISHFHVTDRCMSFPLGTKCSSTANPTNQNYGSENNNIFRDNSPLALSSTVHILGRNEPFRRPQQLCGLHACKTVLPVCPKRVCPVQLSQ